MEKDHFRYDINNRFASLSVNGGPMPPLSDNPLSTESENDNNVNDEAENENAVDDDENDAYITTVWGTRIKSLKMFIISRKLLLKMNGMIGMQMG